MSEQLYGHYRRRRLSPKAKKIIQKYLPSLQIKPKDLSSIKNLFGFNPDALELEIGFGSGEYLLRKMRQNPNSGFIGCEPYLNGVAKFLNNLQPNRDQNVRLYAGNAHDLLSHFPPQSVNQINLLYPDPWPKYRHHHRRFMQTSVLDWLAFLMKPSARIYFASDSSQLTAWTISQIIAHPLFCWPQQNYQNVCFPYWTRYEEKAVQQNQPAVRLVFLRENS